MAETKIEWCDCTFNIAWGCTKVSPACDHCYAEVWAKRTGWNGLWGVDADRRLFGDEHWAQPLKWELRAIRENKRFRVFSSSMADVFDNHPLMTLERLRLLCLIKQTPHLDWLLLTKRIGNAKQMLPADWGDGYPNVWLGATVVNQEEADRDIPKLLRVPAAVRFLSCEPLLGYIRLDEDWLCHEYFTHTDDCRDDLCALNGDYHSCVGKVVKQPALDWIIVGGESGANARPLNPDWAVALREQCNFSWCRFFMKQGSQANWPTFKDFASFPRELQVREWPSAPASDVGTP